MGNSGVLREALFNAKVYSEKMKSAGGDLKKAPERDYKLDALVPVVRGEMQVRIHCHRADDIATALRISEEFSMRFSLEHCTEGYKVKNLLANKNPICVIGPLLLSPEKKELWGWRMDNPAILAEVGVTICLSEDHSIKTKWLPINIGVCIKRGKLSHDVAMRAVTINPARLLGIDDRTGSIDVGKDADIAIFDGDPFSNYSVCEKTIIEGEVYDNQQ
jgi:imidazolonepropionase-like amidohydrolase